jgi:polyhydroxybutyrate depolymerase
MLSFVVLLARGSARFDRSAFGVARFACAAGIASCALVACGDSVEGSKSNFAAPVAIDASRANNTPATPDAGTLSATPEAGSATDAGALVADAQSGATKDAALDAAMPTDAVIVADGSSALADASQDASAQDASAPDAASDASMGDGGPMLPAAQMRTVKVGSTDRTFLLYVPTGLDKTKPVPLVEVFHGFTMSGKIMEEITTWKNIAERERIVVAFPDGGTFLGPWNVGDNVCNIGQVVAGPSDQDDLGFAQAMIDSANASQAINKSAVFVGGFSMGGYFANHVGCQGRAFVHAVSAHSGGTYMGTCPGNPVPVLLIHGDADGLIDYECATQARGYWIERNGCTSQVMNQETIKGGSCDWNQGCPKGLEVGLCTMKGMDHGWAGAPTSGPGAWLTAPLEGNPGYGGGVEYEDAAEMMWKFFKRYL